MSQTYSSTHRNRAISSRGIIRTSFGIIASATLALFPLAAFAVPSTSYLERNALDFAETIKGKYGEMINIAALLNDYDEDLILSVIIVESEGNVKALSHRGAQGLMQLMPLTAKAMGAKDPKEPFQNILAGTKYLRELERDYGFNSPSEALVAYNMGPSRAKRWLSQYEPEDYAYVQRVLFVYSIIKEDNATQVRLAKADDRMTVTGSSLSIMDALKQSQSVAAFPKPIMTKPRTISLAMLPETFLGMRRIEVETTARDLVE